MKAFKGSFKKKSGEEREMFFAKKGAMVAAGPYVQINKDMKRFMRKHCTWHLEDLEDEINE
jgi:hypothetical protein